MIVATISSSVVEKHDGREPTEGGYFIQEVVVDEAILSIIANPRNFLIAEAAIHALQATIDTGLPAEHWTIEWLPEIAQRFNLPLTQRVK